MFNDIILVSPENTGIPAKRQVRETFARRKDRFLQMRNVTGPTERWDEMGSGKPKREFSPISGATTSWSHICSTKL